MSAVLSKFERGSAGSRAARIQPVPIGIVGAGTIGLTVLRQITGLAAGEGRKIAIRSICNSSSAIAAAALTLDDWLGRPGDAVPPDLERLPDVLADGSTYAPIIIDATASEAVAGLHAAWLRAGVHVVTANKLGVAAGQVHYDELQGAGASRGIYAYETTVGAALPVVKTVRELRETGDRITRIRGVLSGTLSYLFNAFDGSRPFSTLLREALELGITEPDPRTDLKGLDVARKLLILARESGMRLELEDVQVDGLVPAHLGECSLQAFFESCAGFDDALSLRLSDAHAGGQVLRYVAELDADGTARVGLRRCDRDSVFATLRHAENVVEVTTARYDRIPLVVRGPGAGREVTAGGVLAEVLRLADVERRRG